MLVCSEQKSSWQDLFLTHITNPDEWEHTLFNLFELYLGLGKKMISHKAKCKQAKFHITKVWFYVQKAKCPSNFLKFSQNSKLSLH